MKKKAIEEEKLKKVNGGAGIGGGKRENLDDWNYKWIPTNKENSENKKS